MSSSPTEEGVKRILDKLEEEELRSGEKILLELYGSLRKEAARMLQGERAGHTLEPTALVHEALIRLLGRPQWLREVSEVGIVLHAVRRCMREILIDHARMKRANKRRASLSQCALDETLHAIQSGGADITELGEAIELLEREHPRACHVFTLRFYFGHKISEVAEMLGVSSGTVENDSRLARGWLRRFLKQGDPS